MKAQCLQNRIRDLCHDKVKKTWQGEPEALPPWKCREGHRVA